MKYVNITFYFLRDVWSDPELRALSLLFDSLFVLLPVLLLTAGEALVPDGADLLATADLSADAGAEPCLADVVAEDLRAELIFWLEERGAACL